MIVHEEYWFIYVLSKIAVSILQEYSINFEIIQSFWYVKMTVLGMTWFFFLICNGRGLQLILQCTHEIKRLSVSCLVLCVLIGRSGQVHVHVALFLPELS